MFSRLRFVCLLLVCAAAPAAAQVGSLPNKSPYLDLEDGQRLGVTAGMMTFGKDPVHVGPSGTAPTLGIRYDLYLGGPVYLTSRLLAASFDRNVLDYKKKPASRLTGKQSGVLTDLDVGLSISATGERSWKGIQPLLNMGVGMIFAPGDSKADVSGYNTKSALSASWGLGVRWVTGKNSELRADLSYYYWQLKYPENYRSTDADPISIYPTGSLTPYTTNRSLTVSYSMGIFR